MTTNMRSFHIWTVGCQMNKADSSRLENALTQIGLAPVNNADEADLVVLNSCVVRQSVEDRVTGMLSTLRPTKGNNPGRVIALMGCMVGPKTNTLHQRFPHVDVFMRPQEYQPLFDFLEERTGIDIDGCIGPLLPSDPKVTTYIPIIHGCDKFCSFCIIPYRRGREKSRTIAEIVRETQLLTARGVREVTLLGQNVDSYGHDLSPQTDLADLLEAIHEIPDISRIRFLTSHPNDMSEKIIQTVADLPKVCENVNLPFQAGDDAILRAMRRGYTNLQYRQLVERIRKTIPSVSLATDLIVGFPGETRKQFDQTYQMVYDMRFDKLHTASYSPRPNTIAWRKLPDDVPASEKKHRLQCLEELQKEIAAEINSKYLGDVYEVLVDGRTNGMWHGRTRTDKLVYTNDSSNLYGRFVDLRIIQTGPWSLRGEMVGYRDY